jgi:hypothetical protein
VVYDAMVGDHTLFTYSAFRPHRAPSTLHAASERPCGTDIGVWCGWVLSAARWGLSTLDSRGFCGAFMMEWNGNGAAGWSDIGDG